MTTLLIPANCQVRPKHWWSPIGWIRAFSAQRRINKALAKPIVDKRLVAIGSAFGRLYRN